MSYTITEGGNGKGRNPFRGESILIYGAPKVGKTTFAASFPSPLFFAFERGHNFIEAPRIDCPYGADGWETFIAALADAEKLSAKYASFVLDTADQAYESCLQYVCAKNSFEHPSQSKLGWHLLQREWDRALGALRNLAGDGVLVFISHLAVNEVKRLRIVFNRLEPTLGTQARRTISRMTSYVWMLGYAQAEADESEMKAFYGNGSMLRVETSQRCLYLAGSESVEAGGRCEAALPSVICPFDGTFAQVLQAHKEIQRARRPKNDRKQRKAVTEKAEVL